MSSSDCRRKTTTKASKAAATLEMLDLALLNAPDLRDMPEGMLALQSCVTGGSDPVLSGGYVGRDKCWLCQCSRITSSSKSDNSFDESCKSKVGVLSEFLPWLCPDCEKAMEEEEKKVELSHLSSVSLDTSDSEESTSNVEPCQCDSCKEVRQSEAEHENETMELQDCWTEVSRNVRQAYSMHKEDSHDEIDVEKMKHLVTRLTEHDAHQLYQRLESQGREVVIEMKVRLLKVLTLDYKTAPGAYQFVSMLLEEYSRLCQSCDMIAAFLRPLVEQHLRQFCVTWQIHNRHLFHCIIFTDPVVQNCLPKAVENIRQGISKSPNDCQMSYSETLTKYEVFVKEMCEINTNWKQCQRLVEKYDEKQAALKVKQKMFKEDWEFFKAQRRLLEQMVPKSKSSSMSCHKFEMQFQQMQKLLQSNKDQEYVCPNCGQVRCTLDENSISHLITCGIISPEVVLEGSNMEPYLNIKPPSMPSSGSSSASGSPKIRDRERFNAPYDSLCGSDEEMVEEPASDDDDDDDDYHECELAPPGCGSGQSLASERQIEGDSTQFDLCLPTDIDDFDGLEQTELKETKPSSSVAKLAFTQVRSDGDPCSCHNCKLQNSTLCMVAQARFYNSKKRQNNLLSNSFSPELCDIPVRVEDGEGDCQMKEKHAPKHAMSPARLVQSCSALLTNPSSALDSLHCLGVNLAKTSCQESHRLNLDSAIDLASSLSHFHSESLQECTEGTESLLHLEKWKMDACTDHWNSSRHKKNILLKIPEKQSVHNEVLEEAAVALKSETAALPAVSKSVTLSSVTKCLAGPSSSTSCQQQSAASPIQPTSSNSKPPSGQTAGVGSFCQVSASKKSFRADGSSDILKSTTCAKQNQQKQATNAPGTQCKGTDQNGGCLIHGCERQREETSENREDHCDHNVTSQKDGKQHCECWHCEFFGREAPSSIPLSKNYLEMRERLRLQLKKKKEKERLGQKNNSDSPQKPSALCNMGVEELMQFINGGCEGNENGKESRSSSRAASKKSKRQKKSKDNIHDFDVSSNMMSSSETSSSLGNLADSGFSSRERTNSKHITEHDMLSADVERLGLRLTSSLELVSSKEPPTHTKRTNDNSVVLDKSAKNMERKGAAKMVRAQSAALERHRRAAPSLETPDIHLSSSLPRNSEAFKTSETTNTNFKNSYAGDAEMNKYSKDSNFAFGIDQALSCKSDGRPKAMQESLRKNLLSKTSSLSVSECASLKAAMENQVKTAATLSLKSPVVKTKKQKRRNRMDGVVIVDDVFLPKENKDVEPEDYDQEVEEFKRFCFSTPPLQKREKLLFPLNLKDIFNRRKWSQGCTS